MLSVLTFCMQGKIENPQDYVSTILSVCHEGVAPPITQVHCRRVVQNLPFKGVDLTEMKSQLRTFNPSKANASIEGKLKGLLTVARVYTCMGCVSTIVVAKRQDMPAIQQVLMEWAKPIMAAQQLKQQVLMQYRQSLFGGQ